jgi:hypothetical protein
MLTGLQYNTTYYYQVRMPHAASHAGDDARHALTVVNISISLFQRLSFAL